MRFKIVEAENCLNVYLPEDYPNFDRWPAWAQKKVDTQNNYSGPNCWNTTIKWFNNKRPLQYTSPEIIERWLRTSTVFTTKLGFETIIVYYDEDHNIIHTAIHIGAGLVFHKRGYSLFEPWEVVDLYKTGYGDRFQYREYNGAIR
jgi:hypothetical protein